MGTRFRLDLHFPPDRCEYVLGEGLVAELGAKVARLATAPSCALVTDANVASTAEFAAAEQSLRRAGLAPTRLVVPAGERSKSADEACVLWESFGEIPLEPDGVVVAMGGGVVGDLAGFCAGTWMRGVALVHVPTTLLAMCDSAVGGKTAVNLAAGKNLVGVVHQPRLVLADLGTLATLPEREMRSGFGEIVKCAVLRDRGTLLRLRDAAAKLLARDGDELAQAVRMAVETKAELAGSDVHDRTGRRALLNLGHTVGHAIEAETGYASLLHGEAVAIGIVVCVRIARGRGLCGDELPADVAAALTALALPTAVPTALDPQRILARTRHDKKRRGKVRRMVLPSGSGGAELCEVEDGELLAALTS